MITTRDYLTRLGEAKYVKDCSAGTTSNFIFEHIVRRFGCPRILMSDHGTHFLKKTIKALVEEFQVHH